MGLTADRDDPNLKKTDPATGQNVAYLVLSEEERAKGFVRPVRRAYIHKGAPGPVNPLRDLTLEEQQRYGDFGYVKFETYPPVTVASRGASGRFWTLRQLDAVGKGCGTETSMGLALCETYAREPSFYGSTFCAGCRVHCPVNEFTWAEDGAVVGS